jgi:hypothetical protein
MLDKISSSSFIINGGIFGAVAGIYKLYKSRHLRNTTEFYLCIGVHMTAGFIYGSTLTYLWQVPALLQPHTLWQLPALFSVYKIGEGLYFGKRG